GPVQNQKKNTPRKYDNKDPVIKNISQEVELNVNSDYDTIALNIVNSYLEGEPKNGDNNNDDESWYSWCTCNEKIPEDWLDPINCKKLTTTIVEVELAAIEKLDEATIPFKNLLIITKLALTKSTKVNKTSQTYHKKIGYQNIATYWEENKIAYLYKSNIINQVTRSDNNVTFFYQKSTKDG
ncbi:31829_t:CDS:2, partial [Gigaspora margarita]